MRAQQLGRGVCATPCQQPGSKQCFVPCRVAARPLHGCTRSDGLPGVPFAPGPQAPQACQRCYQRRQSSGAVLPSAWLPGWLCRRPIEATDVVDARSPALRPRESIAVAAAAASLVRPGGEARSRGFVQAYLKPETLHSRLRRTSASLTSANSVPSLTVRPGAWPSRSSWCLRGARLPTAASSGGVV